MYSRTERIVHDMIEHGREVECCTLCYRILDIAADPLSHDCGGDCWGCIGELDYDEEWDGQEDEWGGHEVQIRLREEIDKGYRHALAIPKSFEQIQDMLCDEAMQGLPPRLPWYKRWALSLEIAFEAFCYAVAAWFTQDDDD